jgi:hypothetical protein
MRRFVDGQYVDVPTGRAPVALSRLPLGLSLALNLDGWVMSLQSDIYLTVYA